MKRRLLLSYVIGFVGMASLILSAYAGAAHQGSVFGLVGSLIGLCLAYPVVIFFGHDQNVPTVALVAIALFEMNAVAFPAFVILSALRKGK
ncbi:MAG TPA: hypothetical protein VE713_00175 [Pyrinomonadaceae bacterium]|jgi:uncharacterized membrane protein|nr:hypothetical protein [Pyrinomonadaceae bacterium]